jgi:hypothetical protein
MCNVQFGMSNVGKGRFSTFPKLHLKKPSVLNHILLKAGSQKPFLVASEF